MRKNGPLAEIETYASSVDTEMRLLISGYPKLEMYQMISYFLGFLDENLAETEAYGGKRFRAGLCMMLTDFYTESKQALVPATAIELFHNFTLIHDDIADRDEFRRGKPTVWKKWGINQALNTGDALMMLVYAEMSRLASNKPDLAEKINVLMNKRFLEVVEGQHMDFLFSDLDIDDPKITEDSVFDMIGRKSGVLVALSAEVAGTVAGQSKEEVERLANYGYSLGLTYQICDDIVSIWGDKKESGKDNLADIREKKKTWPILHLYKQASSDIKEELKSLYGKETDLSTEEIARIKQLLDDSDSKDYVFTKAKELLENTVAAIQALSITKDQKQMLLNVNSVLFAILDKEGL